ncbi:hypothetical protein HCK00_20830 [Streptomyces sp. PLAI1-29]|uniref:Aminodeoxyfutalosine deaminase/Imidazolonepropionase-like composite domain-containing protein n=1 Tax=Streptomyces zingiberis TaxID=2053010 RepID=A0ABX1C5G5_9ACTN|nr:hypothetical protein [Streptomyces zingiberis]
MRYTAGGPPHPGHAVAVDGDRITAAGPYDEVRAACGERARVRDWDGELAPGRHEPAARAWLEATYHPDPREADRLGTAPVTGDAPAALGLTDADWGASARRGLQRLLAAGTTGLTGPFDRPRVRTAVARSGLRVLPPGAPTAPPPLAPGARADFAVHAVETPGTGTPDGPAPGTPAARDAAAIGPCLATVIAGRLVHRRA